MSASLRIALDENAFRVATAATSSPPPSPPCYSEVMALAHCLLATDATPRREKEDKEDKDCASAYRRLVTCVRGK